MKKYVCFLFFCVFINLFAQDSKISINQIIEKNPNCILRISEEKFYLDPRFLSVDENGIRLNIDKSYFSIDALYSDNKGIYLKDQMWPMPFMCEKCGRLNKGYNFVCEYCGTPRND